MSKSLTKTVNLSLPAALLTELDKAAKHEYTSRSDYIRDSILRKLQAAQEPWEAVADFTTVQKGGVDIDELLKHL